MAEKKATGLKAFNQAITNPKTQDYLRDVLGERKGSFINNLTALVANNSSLQECEPYTLMFAAMKATALNLPLDNSLGNAYVIPYKDNKRGITVAQFQLGYKGLRQLALRTNQFELINSTDVREGEMVRRNRLTGEITFRFIDDDAKRAEAKIVGYVSYFQLTNGFKSTFYMSIDEIEKHAMRYSQTYRSKNDYVKKNSPWTTNFDTMALKTVTKLNLSKNAPQSVELADAIRADQSVMRQNEHDYEYMDNDQEQQMIDAQKAQEVAAMFADFDAEDTNGSEIVSDAQQ